MKKTEKKYLSFLLSFLLSLTFFYSFNVRYLIYALVTGAVWGLFLEKYSVKKNEWLYCELVKVSLSNLLALGLDKWLVHHTLHTDIINMIAFAAYVCFLLWIWNKCRSIKKEEQQTALTAEKKQLFPKRQYDLERILEYIEAFQIVGMNGAWGSGKSFLIEQMKKSSLIQENYEVIEIDLLSCNLDEIQITLLNEMEVILRKNGIFSRHSVKLKQMLKEEKFLYSLANTLLAEDMPFSKALQGFREELGRLNRKILIIYEDIDRITEREVIQKIFGISEKLAGANIKVLYQYDEENLKKCGFDRNYLEKYLPYVVNLAEINFTEMLEQVFVSRNTKPEILYMEDFSFFRYNVHADAKVAKKLGLSEEFSLCLQGVTIRKIEHFLEELERTLQSNADYQKKENKRIVIVFFFLKHFCEPYYEKLKQGEELIECLLFQDEAETYTMLELLKLQEEYEQGKAGLSYDRLQKIFSKKENCDTYGILALFGYDYHAYEISREREAIQNEPVENIKANNANEKINRIIWNLLSNGKSENTDYEENVRELIRKVLSKPEDEWVEAYWRHMNDICNGKFPKRDNETVQLFGMQIYTQLFQAFRVCDVSEAEWLKLIKLYFMLEKNSAISVEFIEMINYCDVKKRKVYLEVLYHFNDMPIEGNLNSLRCYRTFLKKYLGAIETLGYTGNMNIWPLEGREGIEHSIPVIEQYMDNCMKELEKSDTELDIVEFHAEITVIKIFIKKNLELIHHAKKAGVPKTKVNTTWETRWKDQKLMDELCAANLSEKELMNELQKCYREEKLDPREIKVILKHYRSV